MDTDATTRPGVIPPAAPRRPVTSPPLRRYSAFLPGMLMAVAFVAWLTFQAVQQVGERQQIGALQGSLDAQELAAKKVRASLDAVATATARLASEGNANASVVVNELKKRGITINAAGAAKPP